MNEMEWQECRFWFTHEKYEIRMVRPDQWIVFGPDGWAAIDNSMDKVKELAQEHLRVHPQLPYEI
jgi:hypothetical protein